jgi:hypothetical protein
MLFDFNTAGRRHSCHDPLPPLYSDEEEQLSTGCHALGINHEPGKSKHAGAG